MRHAIYLFVLALASIFVWDAFVEPSHALKDVTLSCLEKTKNSVGDKQAEALADKACRSANEARRKFP